MTTGVLQERSPALCPLLAAVFKEFDRAGIGYCLLRGYEDVLNGTLDGDIDLLVAPEHFERMRGMLARLGFVALSRWGQAPHNFFIGYDERGGQWIKLDIVDDLAYGRPIPALRVELAAECLRNRERSGPVFVLAAEDEFLTLLLHCLLDKGRFEQAYHSRLAALAREIGGGQYIMAQVAQCFPPAIDWGWIKDMIARGDWEALLQTRAPLADHLARYDRLGTRWRRASRPLLRFLDRRTRSLRGPGMTVALLAPDGAGKTTLAHGLGSEFYLPTRYVYMGTSLTNGAATLPTTRWLARARGPRPLVRALRALNGLIEQGLRYRLGAYHRRRGRLVIFDRYSAGALAPIPSGGAIHKRVQRWLMRRLCPPPDLVVYLDAPAEVLYQRKQEHSPEVLEQQRQRYFALLGGLPGAAVVDARQEPEQVRRAVTGLIWQRYAASLKGE